MGTYGTTRNCWGDGMTENEAIKIINGIEEVRGDLPEDGNDIEVVFIMAKEALEEIQQYRALGTVKELSTSVKEEDILKFYYCESEDDYYIGKRIDTMYYARYSNTGFEWFMSRYLPWGEHIVNPTSAWKEYTYPSEPKEIPFFKWLTGFVKKYCGGTVKEVREAMEKQMAKKPTRVKFDGEHDCCPNCGDLVYDTYCSGCGQKIDYDE